MFLGNDLLIEQRTILGKLAFKLGISQGHLAELLIADSLKKIAPDDAQTFIAASKTRNRHQVQIFANVLCAGLVMFSAMTGHIVRRATRLRNMASIVRVLPAKEATTATA